MNFKSFMAELMCRNAQDFRSEMEDASGTWQRPLNVFIPKTPPFVYVTEFATDKLIDDEEVRGVFNLMCEAMSGEEK